jgi:hypothetical protein
MDVTNGKRTFGSRVQRTSIDQKSYNNLKKSIFFLNLPGNQADQVCTRKKIFGNEMIHMVSGAKKIKL